MLSGQTEEGSGSVNPVDATRHAKRRCLSPHFFSGNECLDKRARSKTPDATRPWMGPRPMDVR